MNKTYKDGPLFSVMRAPISAGPILIVESYDRKE
jgi:hypothetical protein